MRVSPICANYQQSISKTNCKPRREVPISEPKSDETSFKGKHTFAKAFSGIFGAIGTAGAVGGTIIMTGGLVLPAIAAYGAASALSGAIVGSLLDSSDNDKSDKTKK